MQEVLLMFENQIRKIQMTDKIKISIGSGKKNDVCVPDLPGDILQLYFKNGELWFKGKKPYISTKGAIKHNVTTKVCLQPKIALRWIYYNDMSPVTIKIPYHCSIRLGRDRDNDIVLENSLVSSHHLLFQSQNGVLRVKDLNSTNGTYYNCIKMQQAILKPGDYLDLVHIRIVYTNASLLITGIDPARVYAKEIRSDPVLYADAKVERTGHPVFHRSPRMRESLPSEDIVLSPVPAKLREQGRSRRLLSSLLSSGAMLGASAAAGMLSPAIMAMRAATMMAPVANMVSGKRHDKKLKKWQREYEEKRISMYQEYINEQRAHIQSIADRQRTIISQENPAPQDCVQKVLRINRTLWERHADDSDFLHIRLGMGYERLCAKIRAPIDTNGFQLETDELEELAQHIIEETKYVDQIPVRLDLKKYAAVGIVGTRKKIQQFVQNFIISLTTLHYCRDVRIVGIFDPEEREIWESFRWLPHVWDDENQGRYLSFDDVNDGEYLRFCDLIESIVNSRIDDVRAAGRCAGQQLPHYVFLMGSRRKIEQFPMMRKLLNGDGLGITALFMFDDVGYLPPQCQYIINLQDPYGENVASAFQTTAINEKIWFIPDPPISKNDLDSMCRRMSAIEMKGISTAIQMPNTVSFLQGMNVSTVRELHAWENWTKNCAAKTLKTPIAAMNGGKIFYMDNVTHQRAHGLVAGMPGSGKSEMLASWVLSLAVQYHPYEVSFVIVDYKGGSLANALSGIPHVVGTITNLGKNRKVETDQDKVNYSINRSFAALHNEIKRREGILADAGVDHIEKYMLAFNSGRVSEPLPRLIIIMDEFAELKKNAPEFMKAVTSISALGRSLGVHLVLATQSPEGAVDETTWKNTTFQICLKVQNANASKVMIQHPDGARITQAGRAYIRIGTAETAESYDLVQTFWAGAPYIGDKNSGGGNQVRVVEMNGERIKTVYEEKTRFKSDKTELQAVSTYLTHIAQEHQIHKLTAPWFPELPERLTLRQLMGINWFDGNGWNNTLSWLQVPIGMYDLPDQQQQGVQYLDFLQTGHYGIYGSPGTGKTTLLKTIIVSMCNCYTPRDVNFYILDFGGWSMNILQEYPHVGGIALDFEEEKFSKLAGMITNMFEERNKLFLKHNVGTLKEYRETVSNDMPAVILAIDNLVPIFEQYPAYEKILETIAANGASRGIYLLYTANSNTGIRFKIFQKISGAIAFNLTDKSDYALLVGSTGGKILPDVTGRAFLKTGSGLASLEIQVSQYAEGENDFQRNQEIVSQMKQMNLAWDGARPQPIPVMPDHVDMDMLCPAYTNRNCIPIGYGCTTIEPAFLDFTKGYNAMITGKIGSGKSALLCWLAELCIRKFPQAHIFVFDSRGKGLVSIRNLCYAYALDHDPQVSFAMDSLIQIISSRMKEQKHVRQEQGEAFDEKQFAEKFDPIYIFIDNLSEFSDCAPDDVQIKMDRVLRLAKGLGVYVLAACRIADAVKLANTEQLTTTILSCQIGLALSDSAMHYTFFDNDLDYSGKNETMEEGFGLLYTRGHCQKVKLPKI